MKQLFCLLFICQNFIALSQDFTNQWTGYFSYLDIRGLSTGNNRVYAAAQNAIFEYEPNSQTTVTTDAINGLEGSEISAIYYSENFGLSVIGFENGLLQVVMDNNGQVFTVVDILNKQTIAPDVKRINHFYEYQDKLYISTEFGIAEYNLANLEFGDSFFIGNNGQQLEITQTTIVGNVIYASTIGGGIRFADVDDPNLVDFDVWNGFGSPNWQGILNFNNQLLGIQSGNRLMAINSNIPNLIQQFDDTIIQLESYDGFLVIVTNSSVHIFNENLNEIGFVDSLFDGENNFEINFSCAIVVDEILYIGDSELGLLRMEDFNSSTFTTIGPDGPILNSVFSITSFENELWVVYGEYTEFQNPNPLNNRGISHFTGDNWSNLSFDELNQTRVIVDATVDESNPQRVYLSSFVDGLLILENEEVVEVLNSSNSGIDNTVGGNGQEIDGDNRIGASVFNSDGDLYFSNALTENPLKRLSGNNQVQIADISDVLVEPLETSSAKVVTDNSGNVYLATFKLGIFGYQPSNGRSGRIASDVEGVDFPEVFNVNPPITALEFDKSNRLWIGTNEGLRVCFNPQAMFDENARLNVSPIIFLEDGVAQELLFEQFITDLKTDGAGNIWISTADSGVFQVSSTGQDILNIFNQDNSPLPSNTVISVDINSNTGEVFFGTSRGLVSYQSRITDGEDSLENVRVFPNPVRPGFTGIVTIDGLTDDANVKITDVTGNLVYEEFASGGSVQWDTRAFGKHKVASGVYLVLITSEDQLETQVAKIMVIR
jgi:hypothetical protein